ncbi:MAG: hypothetical protein H7Z42_04655, partial [Roseiflexaceae bacterium]|nr:hypothetical protein [Roseiflexaceae bacterium]
MLRYRTLPNQIVIYTVLIGGSLVMMYPLLFMALASFTTTAEYTRTTWIPLPTTFHFDNYGALFFAAR